MRNARSYRGRSGAAFGICRVQALFLTDDLAPSGEEDSLHQKAFCLCGLGGNFLTVQTSRPRRTFQPPPTPRRALSPGFLPGAFSSWSASPAPAALYSTLASLRSLYSRLSMDRSRERSRLPTCPDLGYAQASSFWALRFEKTKLGLMGTCLGKGSTVPVVGSASTGRRKGGDEKEEVKRVLGSLRE